MMMSMMFNRPMRSLERVGEEVLDAKRGTEGNEERFG